MSVGVQRDSPLALRGDHFAAVPEAVFGEIAADDGGELLPDFIAARAEQIA